MGMIFTPPQRLGSPQELWDLLGFVSASSRPECGISTGLLGNPPPDIVVISNPAPTRQLPWKSLIALEAALLPERVSPPGPSSPEVGEFTELRFRERPQRYN